MANPFNMQEVSLADLADSTNAINQIGNAAANRKSAYQPHTVIVTDHKDTTVSLTGWPDGGGSPTDTPENEVYMTEGIAVFTSKRHGEPWCKDYGVLEHIIAKGSIGTTATITPVVVGGVVTSLTVAAGGTGYAPKEYIFMTDGTATVDAIGVVGTVDENGTILTAEVIEGGSYTVDPSTTAIGAFPTNVSKAYPDYDYATFE